MGNPKSTKEQLSIFELLASNNTVDIGKNFSPDQIQELINTLNSAKQSAKQRERNERLKKQREERSEKNAKNVNDRKSILKKSPAWIFHLTGRTFL